MGRSGRFAAQRDGGNGATNADWVRLLGAELGPEAQTGFADMMAGKLVVPTGAFAPCFRLERIDEPAFDLGFDPAILNAKDKTIGDVRAGSVAAAAGLRAGDVVVEATPVSDLQADAQLEMTMRVSRAGETVTVHYLPRGALVESYRWVRDPKVTARACRI